MSQWKEQLNCKECNELLDIPLKHRTNFKCKHCNRLYIVKLDNIQYAIADSAETQYYKFLDDNDDNTIGIRCFQNKPIDEFEEAYQDTINLDSNECRPDVLLPLVKKYHDALKMCVRRLLELYPGNLSLPEIEQVKKDNQRKELSLNIKNLFNYLKNAYSSKSADIDDVENTHKDMIERIWWVRNKLEHSLYTQWLINAKIFQELRQEPSSSDPARDHLNYNFIERVNHTTLDIYRFIITLRPIKPETWQINRIESFRVKNNL